MMYSKKDAEKQASKLVKGKKLAKRLFIGGLVLSSLATSTFAYVSNVENKYTEKFSSILEMVTNYKSEKTLEIEKLNSDLTTMTNAYDYIKQVVPTEYQASHETIVGYINHLNSEITRIQNELDTTKTNNQATIDSLNAQITELTNTQNNLNNALNSIKAVVPSEYLEDIPSYIVKMQNDVTTLLNEKEDQANYILHLESLVNGANDGALQLEKDIQNVLGVNVEFDNVVNNVTTTLTYNEMNTSAKTIGVPSVTAIQNQDGNTILYVETVGDSNTNYECKIYDVNGNVVLEDSYTSSMKAVVNSGVIKFKVNDQDVYVVQ